MGRAAPVFLLLAVVSLVAAGCAEPAKESNAPGPSTTAPVPTVGAETGSIAGTVVTDELSPIPDVEVAIVESGNATKSDAAGAFTFNDLAPGTYTLVAQRLGYESGGKKVEVRIGEISEVQIVLLAMDLDNESYVLTIPKVALIHYGARVLNLYGVTVLNQSAVNQLSCDPCYFVLHHPATPKAVLTEPEWPNANTCPNTNCDVWIYYKHEWTNHWYIGDGSLTTYSGMGNRGQLHWSEAAVSHLKGKDKVLLALAPSYYGSIEQKVTTYTSFAYNEGFPDEFTALPPLG